MMEALEKIFGRRMLEAAGRRNITLAELSRRIGVHSRGLYGYSTEEKVPNLHTAVLISDGLGVSLDWLCGRDSDACPAVDEIQRENILKKLEETKSLVKRL